MVFFVNVVNVACVKISVQNSIVLGILENGYIIRVQFGSFESAAMNFIPFLNSFDDFGILLTKFFTQFMKLPKEPAPSSNHWFVLHPSKLDEIERASLCPLKNSNNKIANYHECLMWGFSDRPYGRADMIQFGIYKIIYKEKLISDPLQVFVLRIGGDSHREFLLSILRKCFKSVVLGCFDELS